VLVVAEDVVRAAAVALRSLGGSRGDARQLLLAQRRGFS